MLFSTEEVIVEEETRNERHNYGTNSKFTYNS